MAETYPQTRDTELILPPGVFAFVQDQTKGHVNVLCGPMKQSLSNTDLLVTYDSKISRFVGSTQPTAIQTNVIAPKGSYVVLTNPQREGKQPEPGKAEVMPVGTLRYGQIENLPGPQSFPLWPGQVATVVKGHHLRSNQYLMVRVYDDDIAKANWDKSVVKAVVSESSEHKSKNTLGIDKETLVTGQLIVIKGTDVAFYIPPTGIEVLEEDGNYIRDAVTLERLEYSILLEENGNKEYKEGPQVVFPTPTQKFYVKDGLRKFRAFELQASTGIHVKVIVDYKDKEEAGSKEHKAGDELFITGADMPIYFPRPEHAIISYGGQEKTFAVAIPSGEGRYVLNRQTGVIDLVEGPKMFLPNAITQVIAKRQLSDTECKLYYPGNTPVLEYNRSLATNPTSVSTDLNEYLSDTSLRTRSFAYNDGSLLKSATGVFGDELNRGTKYQPPRSITLSSKFDGVPKIEVWSGYAVQVVTPNGDRRTVVGPKRVLLQYDETLTPQSISKGKPKSSDNKLETVYLKYDSNPVSDILNLKTQDLVNVSIQVKYLVKFDLEDKDKWFALDNYVQYLCDHLRSLIGNTVRNIGVQDFYSDAANILRDTVLGKKEDILLPITSTDESNDPDVDPLILQYITEQAIRTKKEFGKRPLKHFIENGMTVYDLELISIQVEDSEIAKLLSSSKQETLAESIKLERSIQKLKIVKNDENIKRQIATELAETQKLTDELDSEMTTRKSQIRIAEVDLENELKETRKTSDLTVAEISKQIETTLLEIKKSQSQLSEELQAAELDRKIKLLVEEAKASDTKMKSVQPALVEALVALATVGQFENIAQYLAPLSIVQGQSLSGTLNTMFKGTAIEGMVDNLNSLSKVKKLT